MGFENEKARDALAFEPLESRYVAVTDDGIEICTRYSEHLSRLLKSLPSSKWDSQARCWRYPFTAGNRIREALPEIERLADAAKEKADRETEKREEERNERKQKRELARRKKEEERAMAEKLPLRQQFCKPLLNRPHHPITLEAIGDNTTTTTNSFLGQLSHVPPRHWVAQIFGWDGRGFVRSFVSGSRDYSRANSVGSRGVFVTYFLREGPIYEVSSPESWGKTERYFLRVIDGEEHRLTKQDVLECLEK